MVNRIPGGLFAYRSFYIYLFCIQQMYKHLIFFFLSLSVVWVRIHRMSNLFGDLVAYKMLSALSS